MPQINEDIRSEIEGLQDTSREVKDFLLWVVNFEHENIDKESFSYKTPIQEELQGIINRKNGSEENSGAVKSKKKMK